MPLLNLASILNSGDPHPAQTKVPLRFSLFSGLPGQHGSHVDCKMHMLRSKAAVGEIYNADRCILVRLTNCDAIITDT